MPDDRPGHARRARARPRGGDARHLDGRAHVDVPTSSRPHLCASARPAPRSSLRISSGRSRVSRSSAMRPPTRTSSRRSRGSMPSCRDRLIDHGRGCPRRSNAPDPSDGADRRSGVPVRPSRRRPSAPVFEGDGDDGIATGHDQDYGEFLVSSGPYMYRVRTTDLGASCDRPRGSGRLTLVRNPWWYPATNPSGGLSEPDRHLDDGGATVGERAARPDGDTRLPIRGTVHDRASETTTRPRAIPQPRPGRSSGRSPTRGSSR